MAEYDAEIAGCQQEIRDLMATRHQIDQQVAALQLMLTGLLQLKQIPVLPSGITNIGQLMRSISPTLIDGLADQCRRVLRLAQGDSVTPMQVKKQLDQIGFDFSGYKTNPLSSIHTTLKRIVDGKEFQTVTIRGKGVAYKWIRPNV